MPAILRRFWEHHPLASIILIALIPRLVAAFFSQGYGMHDDHFGPIEQPFIIMHDPAYWNDRMQSGVHGHSIVYPGIHYVLFKGLQAVGMQDPQQKMLVVRLLHALYSLLVVYFGYRIAEKYSTPETAKKAGLLLALFWPLPFISVHNLIEVVCIPPMMAGLYYILRSEEKRKFAFYAGLCFGLAFVFRYQTVIVAGVAGLVLLFQKQWKECLLTAAGFLVSACLIQGSADIFAWGVPFAALYEYVTDNAAHSMDYAVGPWYNYTLLLLGAFIPPVSFFLFYGWFKNWKKTQVVFFSTLAFFIFLSYFPNKQERFVFSVVPPIFLLSVIGWMETTAVSEFWQKHRKAVRNLWIWFWILNFVLLIPFSLYYAKRSRCESMYYFYGKDLKGLIVVGGNFGAIQPPQFYADKCFNHNDLFRIEGEEDIEPIVRDVRSAPVQPNYAIFFGIEGLDARHRHMENALGEKLILEKRIDPSFLDDVFFRLNPKHNKNQSAFIYRIEK
jgi:hypothetical protein